MVLSDFSAFRENLKYLITSSGKLSKDVAADLGIAAPTLSRYVSGERTPDLEYVLRMAKYFHVSVEWLLGLSEEKPALQPQNAEQELVELYKRASSDDRYIIDTILKKYRRPYVSTPDVH